jgi:hypothetical protein
VVLFANFKTSTTFIEALEFYQVEIVNLGYLLVHSGLNSDGETDLYMPSFFNHYAASGDISRSSGVSLIGKCSAVAIKPRTMPPQNIGS